jgi:hypothetical protein
VVDGQTVHILKARPGSHSRTLGASDREKFAKPLARSFSSAHLPLY